MEATFKRYSKAVAAGLLLSFHEIIYFFFDTAFLSVYPLSAIKATVYRILLGCRLEKSVFIHKGVRFISPKNINIQEKASLMYGTVVEARFPVHIGRNSLVSPHVYITTGSHELDDLTPAGGEVRIGDNCYIGARAIILPGVSIGTNSVVGAGSIVTKDIPANVVAVGAPARVIKEIEPSDKVWTLSGVVPR